MAILLLDLLIKCQWFHQKRKVSDEFLFTFLAVNIFGSELII